MKLILGDCLEQMGALPADSVDAVVTDPPYGLGFMGKQWDTMPPGDETASAALRVLKPAHYLVAFGGTRTHHRLMVALEDAGFEIRDCLMWLYGSGFPKGKGNLKPAYEPIILCRKPGKGVRALGIDECRIDTDEDRSRPPRTPNAIYGGGNGTSLTPSMSCSAGRWPANIILDEHIDLGGPERFFYCAKASRAERNAGCEGLEAADAHNLSSNACGRCGLRVKANGSGNKCQCGELRETVQLPRSGNSHPTVKPVAIMRWLTRLISPEGGTVLDPFMGSGTTGVACVEEGRDFIGIEREPEYIAIARARIGHADRERQLAIEGWREVV